MAAAWSEYGEVWVAATCDMYAGARLVGWRGAGTTAPRPVGAGHVAPRKRTGTTVPRCMDRRAEAGLGARATQARRRALWTPRLKPFRLTPFDRVFLQLFQLKWAE
jgi:hypothetical protein